MSRPPSSSPRTWRRPRRRSPARHPRATPRQAWAAATSRPVRRAKARRMTCVRSRFRWPPATRSCCGASASTPSSLRSSRSVYRLMARLDVATPRRRTRRSERDRHGDRIDMRRTLRGSMRTAGDPIRLARRRRRVVRRRVVMLCDISGSMEPYARAYLQFLTCAAGSGPNAEAFVFATRLTRLTRALRSRSPERAIQRAAEAAPDWSSGTRIGEALKAFNDRHGRRGMARGALVVILSDGWERGDPALVAREMERLSRLAYRIVWVNPRAAASDFSPRTGGMAAALPHCDALVSGHSLDALDEVVEAIASEERWRRLPSPSPTRRRRGRAPPRSREAPWRCRAGTGRAGAGRRPAGGPMEASDRPAKTCIYPGCERPAVPPHPLGGPQPSFCDLEEHNALTRTSGAPAPRARGFSP